MSRRLIVRAALLAGAIVGATGFWISFHGRLDPSAVEAAVGELGALAPLMFVGAFALATVVFLPGSIFGLAGGVIFGPAWGTVWNLAGGTLGATLAFLSARFIGGDWIAAKAGGRLKIILVGIDAEGWRFVALTRLVPIVPFNVLNYALGLTRIPLSRYVIASLVCMAPGAAAYAWMGYAGRSAMEGNSAAFGYGALGLAALALIAFAPRLVRRLNRLSDGFLAPDALKRGLAGGQRPLIVDVREPDEFAGPLGHIPGSLNVPLRELPARCDDLRTRVPVVVVCRTDKRSAKAAEILRASGIDYVCVLRGGMEAWNRESSIGRGVGRAKSRDFS